MVSTCRVAAVDLGASSGRVMVGTVGADRLELEEVHRFANGPVRVGNRRGSSTLHWDIIGIYREVLAGVRAALRVGPLDAMGIDSWAVDYGLLDERGGLLGNPVNYRDARTHGVMERVLETIPAADLYSITGLQQVPFNTVYQLIADRDGGLLRVADMMLMIPDLLGFWLTGQVGAEATNASTTQLYDVRARMWATELAERVGIPARILPPLRQPGDIVGQLLPEVSADLGIVEGADVPVIAVGSHDTASAVVAVPFAQGSHAAFICSGTWSLVGVELDKPVLTEAALEANFGNEGGVDGRIRFLRNVMGLWVLSETLRTWSMLGRPVDLATLLRQAADVPPLRAVVAVDAQVFLAPGDMEARIARVCEASGQPVPASPPEVVRCILESLALAYRRNVRRASALSGRPVDVVHMVGGGALNELLCQLTADACGVPVLAGPAEAAAMGNVLVQARTLGADLPDLDAMRALVAATHSVTRYEPSGRSAAWDEAEERLAVAQRRAA
jgi:rhamnulokinase